jgi:predicted enzyme involved in methoxymalonyl-ACP biosynthesis
VLGRGVEALVLAELAARAAAQGCERLEGAYVPSGRNGMVADLYPRLGMAETARDADGASRFSAAPAALGPGSGSIAVERA